jgi:CBS domain-containing protein
MAAGHTEPHITRVEKQTRIHELLSADACQVLTSGQTVEHAARRMLAHGVSLLPVCRSSGMVVGVITERDIIKSVAQARAPELCGVDEVMTRVYPVCLPDDLVSDVYARTLAEGIDRVVVRDVTGRLVGVLDRARLSGAAARPPAITRRLRKTA